MTAWGHARQSGLACRSVAAADPEFRYSDLLPLGADQTPYRLVTTEGVSTFEAGGRTFLQVTPEAIRQLTAEAMHDIAHYLRPAHLAQLRRIIDDPESSGNDRFVALDLLKNVNICAGGVLPMCQDTGTAIVMGKKSEGVLTGADDAEAISLGVYDAYTKLNLRYSQLAPITMWEEKNTGTNLPAQIELYSTPRGRPRAGVQVPLHGQGRRLGQQVLPLPGDEGGPEPQADAAVPRREDPLARHGRLPAVPPGRGHRRHVGGVRAEDGEVRLGALPRQPADLGIPVGARVPRPRARGGGLQAHAKSFGIGAQFGGKYFCHDVRVVRLPRHGASCPVALAVSCSADRQALGKITAEGVFLEQLETDPAQYMPDAGVAEDISGGSVVSIDLNQPMPAILAELSRHPVKTGSR